MRYWKKLPTDVIRQRIFEALDRNVSFFDEEILGVPASYLDRKVFPHDLALLQHAPFLTAMLHNPNHIGCHTLGESEDFFAGTQELEREVIRICAEDILKGAPDAQDGYIASGGTEANIQALWIYRNYFIREKGARPEEIAIICSADNHYSVAKGADLLQVRAFYTPVDEHTRRIDAAALRAGVRRLKAEGYRFVIVVANMMTTMFGSVDDPDLYGECLETEGLEYRMHVDGAYGGFFYPFSNQEHTRLHFGNPRITSVTLDAHKMVQAPYGTGVFLIRKGWMDHVFTPKASYVKGLDSTLVGSRSGANAIAVWMILMTYGPHGWYEKIQVLQLRTQWLAQQLDRLGVAYYRQPYSNIVAIRAEGVPQELAARYRLVPDNHHAPRWYKVVVMDHVTVDQMERFIGALEK